MKGKTKPAAPKALHYDKNNAYVDSDGKMLKTRVHHGTHTSVEVTIPSGALAFTVFPKTGVYPSCTFHTGNMNAKRYVTELVEFIKAHGDEIIKVAEIYDSANPKTRVDSFAAIDRFFAHELSRKKVQPDEEEPKKKKTKKEEPKPTPKVTMKGVNPLVRKRRG